MGVSAGEGGEGQCVHCPRAATVHRSTMLVDIQCGHLTPPLSLDPPIPP